MRTQATDLLDYLADNDFPVNTLIISQLKGDFETLHNELINTMRWEVPKEVIVSALVVYEKTSLFKLKPNFDLDYVIKPESDEINILVSTLSAFIG